ncbi:class I SAM-dependent methyltransferase [Amycolatopsis azurea]|uniref:SAM-dependent methyltransferase n=1 Tax=Amycolatopsis azurea DSM 43854 TaxID=1238180 RepID=M2P312_9PSEU|nr:class I SAM-dependent methyltransferase [Amycolatopsis azurea]EMD29544.1 UbiE/COQ5 methyltransferase [Amycolatopsis azurea DSM 43854]OOC02685.1 SAM-dependent methyltransferase [Amycolatopsis azurea DSM 43854]
MTTAAQEAFLREFHARNPAATSGMMSQGRTPDGRSSYEILKDHVSGHVRVLDLGCGDGFLLDLLAKAGHQVAGVDLSSADLALARQRPSLHNVPLTTGRAQELPFPDGGFDACVSHMAFMLMPDIDQVAAEVARVLAPGGRLALILSSGRAGGSGSYELFQKLIRPALDAAPPDQRIPSLGDNWTLHQDGINEILVPAGFSPVVWGTEPIDLGGTAEQVWSRLSLIYNFMPLDPAVVRSLEAEFLTQAAEMTDADGRIPCTMNVHVAATERS